MTYWLSYGGGVNSTALMVMLCELRLPQFTQWRTVWADTKDEKDETYEYVFGVIQPYLRRHGKTLEIVCPGEGVLERWERLKVTGSRIHRSCTDHAKITPLNRYIDAIGSLDDSWIVGIDASESHRATPQGAGRRPRHYPLVDLDIDRDGCVKIIQAAGLPVPVKSGCWHCPFMRVGEVLELAKSQPDKMRRIHALEMVATETHGINPKTGGMRTQWGDKPAKEWAKRSCEENSSGPLFQEIDPDPPCGCYDG